MAKHKIKNVVVVSDLHCGCKLALCPPSGIPLDDGGFYYPSPLQKKMWKIWTKFWEEWVPQATKGEPYAVVINGDVVDGVHHKSTTQISHNLSDQSNIAQEVLEPIIEKCNGQFYMVRGTEAHVGSSGVDEERLARALGAIPNETLQYSRHELWMEMGGGLIHFAHHIGTTGSTAYETSSVMKELSEMFTEAGRWQNRHPDVIVRSHRHRHIEVRVPTSNGYGIAFVTAAWQAKTPFAFRIPGGRTSQPQFGGSLIRKGDRILYTDHYVVGLDRPNAVSI